jgi:hypothetical protein
MIEANAIGQEGFYLAHRLGLLAAGVALVLLVLELVRRGHLKERYALLWLGASFGALAIGLFPNVIARVSVLLELQYLTVVFVACFLFLLALVLAFSAILSQLSERCRELAQEVALLEARLEKMEAARHDP